MIIPKNVDLHTWAASLAIDFPEDNVPLLRSGDTDWKSWGAALVQCNSFSQQDAPSTDSTQGDDWHDWAMSIYLAMANI